MKKILFSILILAAFVNAAMAQDDIILRTGEEIKAKVQEVGTSEIKYKRSDNANGPLYVIWKREVFMIKYENGTKDVFSTVEAPSMTSQNPMCKTGQPVAGDYKSLHHMAVKRIAGGAVMIAVGVPVVLTGIGLTLGAASGGGTTFDPTTGMEDHSGDAPMLAAGVLLTAAGVVLEVLGPLSLKKGLKYRRMAKEAKGTVGFAPIRNPALDRYNFVKNSQTVGAVTFTF